ncbi:FixH family protein [Erythrobacter sp. CCH5-A1]|jgi:nitrogen fixation protein FixH|uniref:FixH family protein n=1 Tax=Erythrobacter sp. CCH5-A1 TaxID=1768792 RepID=UPI0008365F90|nr:FixH family protein [Erythrobacter sp. CCH5-A1]
MARPISRFTGKHMAAIFVGGFAIVIAVNLLMASIAVGSFHGTVVDNSYVASQNYNGWLKQAAASKALGWQAVPHRRNDGRVVVETLAVPAGAQITGTAEHPLGLRADTPLTFAPLGKGSWVSNQTIAPGRWRLRLAIRAGDEAWAGEAELR